MPLVRHVVDSTITAVRPGAVVRVLDPACGDGRFLFAAAERIRSFGGVPVVTGADVDLGGLAGVEHPEPVEMIATDSLQHDWRDRVFDVVIGNPPFLSQLASATVRPAGSSFGGGPYADAAADFLALAVQRARPTGGRIGLVLPASLLTARDAGPIRAAALHGSTARWFWWAPDALFDATVRTCAIGIERGAVGGAVARCIGSGFDPVVSVPNPAAAPNHHWGALIADVLGVPTVPEIATDGVLADHGLATANFRDQYYGMVGAVSDETDGPPLVTTGLIDVGRCHWGDRPTRFAKQRFLAPRVDRRNLAPFMQRWADRCLVPKVLLATQTRVLEAVADPAGAWLPAVPVVRVVPHGRDDLWPIAAVLTSPTASAVVAGQAAGSGLSAATIRVSQRTLAALGWPAGSLDAAVAALRDGDVASCGTFVDAAFGVEDQALFDWWWAGVRHGARPR
jgi:hypothetical protein